MRGELAEVRERYDVPDVLLPLVDAGLALAMVEEALPEGWRFWGVRRASGRQSGEPNENDPEKAWSAAAAEAEGQGTAFAFGPTGTDALWGLVDRLRERS